MDGDEWPSGWYRAILWACALSVIDDLGDNAYGYSIGARLEERRFGSVTGGTLYPILKRLEADGFVTTQWREGDLGPGRKHYRLTSGGRARLSEVAADWSRFSAASAEILKGHHGEA
ncbi:MAG TPA: PadR family transcriptional regulator [Microlunatus sp.]